MEARFAAMDSTSIKDAPAHIPDGYLPVAVSADQAAAPLRLCVLVRARPEPVSGRLVLLRDLMDAQVYLGCITDAAGRVLQWVELWVQNASALAGSPAAQHQALTNTWLDERWRRHVEAFDRLAPGTIIRTGWETANPPPVFLDAETRQPLHPLDDSGKPWQLCRDDALLKARGLPPYSTCLHRYLYVEGTDGPFVIATADAPANDNTRPLSELTGARDDLVPLNPSGSYMLVRAYSPISYQNFVDFVAGGVSTGISHGSSALHLRRDAPTDDAPGALASEGWLYLGKHGRSGRLLEALHLKLRALTDAVLAVRHVVQTHQVPLLNLTADSFQVRLADTGSGLPTLWTGRAVLVDPGDAVEFRIEGVAHCFAPARPSGSSIYRPEMASSPSRGRCSLRIRQVLAVGGGASIIEGTFITQERLVAAANDLLWLRLILPAGPVNLYARMEAQTALASGECRFRTVQQHFEPPVGEQLKAAAGVPLNNALFEIVPQLSTPCDLYSLAVLAVRTLLVGPHSSLPVALDEMLSLARQVAVEHDPAVPLAQRIGAIFERDARWVASLGPQHLVAEQTAPQEAFDLIPPEVWWDVLGCVVRMFPGIGPDSVCADYSDAPAAALHKVFDDTAARLEWLLLRTRSLIVIDWRANREIHAVIRGYLARTAPGAAGAPLAAR
jgi:hypothetical protein